MKVARAAYENGLGQPEPLSLDEVRVMARYSVETKLSPEEAIRSATVYFGVGGLGLKVAAEEGACCASFEGGGGHVLVTAVEDGGRTEVVLETREWDHHVKRFMRAIAP